ncbi:hypothetical protein PUN71_015330 [Arthrobacter sp. NQ7]|uniref:hypothetical protein n=1 Tax=Arthrobacter sp. NQ7 TaxID=3032303 RepID=UPI00240F6C77|nr:hypothetical protein [Arthrobacter sp. NQ7]MDJ0458575.1 hypothetical protein [Arthrobacter sp. NQ7]
MAIAVLSTAAWMVGLVPYAPVWGDLATWASAVATGGGLFFAGRSIQLQTRQRIEALAKQDKFERETREARARSVGFKTSWIRHTFYHPDGQSEECWALKYVVQNNSATPVTNVVVHLWDPAKMNDQTEDDLESVDTMEEILREAQAKEWDYFVNRYLGTILPGEKVGEEVPIRHPKAGPELATGLGPQPKLRFTDAWRETWVRTDGALTEAPTQEICLCGSCGPQVQW